MRKVFREFLIFFLISFTSILYAQINLILYYFPDNTPFNIKCNPLHEDDIECEYNEQKFDNYKEFIIENDTLKIKAEFKQQLLNKIDVSLDYDIISIESLADDTSSRLTYLFEKNT